MKQPQDDDPQRLEKVLRSYSERIAAVDFKTSPAPKPQPESLPKAVDHMAPLWQKLAWLEEELEGDSKKGRQSIAELQEKLAAELKEQRTEQADKGAEKSAERPAERPPEKRQELPKRVRRVDSRAVTTSDEPLATPPPRPAPVQQAPAVPAASMLEKLPSSRALLGASCTALMVVCLGFLLRPSIHRSFPLSYDRSSGLALKDQELFTVDPTRQFLFTVSMREGRIKAVQKFSNASLNGLTLGDGCFWSTDSGLIHQHDLDSDHTVRQSFREQRGAPGVLFWDWGRHSLWVADASGASVRQYTIGSGLEPAGEYALAKSQPAGLYVSGKLLWVLDSATKKIYRYSVGQALTPSDSVDLGRWLPKGCRVTGMSADATHLWVVSETPAQVHRFDLGRLSGKFKKA